MANLIDKIQKRIGMYISPITLQSLNNFLQGYLIACDTHNITDDIFDSDLSFHDWVAMQEGYEYSNQGWANIIEQTSSSDEEALEKFFTYYHNYKNRTPKTILKLSLPKSYSQFGWKEIKRDHNSGLIITSTPFPVSERKKLDINDPSTVPNPTNIEIISYGDYRGVFVRYILNNNQYFKENKLEYYQSYQKAIEDIGQEFDIIISDGIIIDKPHP